MRGCRRVPRSSVAFPAGNCPSGVPYAGYIREEHRSSPCRSSIYLERNIRPCSRNGIPRAGDSRSRDSTSRNRAFLRRNRDWGPIGHRFRNTFATRNGSLRFGRQNAAGPDAPKARGRALLYPESIRCRCGVRKPNPTPVSSRISRALFCTCRSRRSTGPISRCERQERCRRPEAATRKVRNPSRTGRPKMPDGDISRTPTHGPILRGFAAWRCRSPYSRNPSAANSRRTVSAGYSPKGKDLKQAAGIRRFFS